MAGMNTNHSTAGPVAVLVDDLYFASIISSAAKKLETDITYVRNGSPIPCAAPLALVDIQLTWDWEAIVREYAENGGYVVGFGPHTDTALRKRARAAGCRRVLAKSKFVSDLPSILTRAPTKPSGSSAVATAKGEPE